MGMTECKEGRQVTLTIEKIVPSGAGMGRIDGKVCFVHGALPGELVEVRITKEKKDFTEGEVTALLEPSPYRITPRCAHYYECGGCSAQHITYEYQLSLKEEILRETLSRQGGLSAEDIESLNLSIEPSQPWEYRNRVQFQSDPPKKGFYQKGSNRVIPITSCPVLVPSLNTFLVDWNPQKESRLPLYGSDRVYQGDEPVEVSIDGTPVTFGANLFFQSNMQGLETLVGWIKQQVTHGERCADLYGGVGLFGAVLESRYTSVVVVERDKRVLPYARKNISKGEVYTKSVERWFSEHKQGHFDLVVVDPPRGGLSADTRNSLIRQASKELLYVSCNPVTQARDMKFFLQHGYRIKSAQGFDFYPQTFHFESVILFEREPS